MNKLYILDNTDLNSDAKNLFEESYLCYKNTANRAALLFSYLGLLTQVKGIIISSRKPDTITTKRWDEIIRDLNNEEKWEERVFKELMNSTTPIFNISDSIRHQIKYWKDRRNDCAHIKENYINHAHIEMLWSFVKSNLSKITIEGGKSNLLKKFAIHFDETKTPPNADFSDLISEIVNAISIAECDSFFIDLDAIIAEFYPYDIEKSYEIYNNIFRHLNNSKYIERLISYIKSKSKEDFDLNFIMHHPQLIHEFQYTDQEIREIWKRRLGKRKDRLRYHIYAILLRNNLIPQAQIQEAMDLFYDQFDQKGYDNIPDDEIIKLALANKELLDTIYNQFFENKDISEMSFMDINLKADLIQLLFEYRNLNINIVGGLIEMYSKGTNHPWWLTTNLKTLFDKKPKIKEKFESICAENSLSIPEELL